MSTATATNLTTQQLKHWHQWCINELTPSLMPFRDVQKPGRFLIISSRYKPSFNEIGNCWAKEVIVEKVTKLKIGNEYRGSIEGCWVVPDNLIESFHQCREVAVLYRDLRRNAIDLVSRLPRNGYELVGALSPEKMKSLIELFSDS